MQKRIEDGSKMSRLIFMRHSKAFLSQTLSRTPLQYWPVRVRRGIARGARWTLLPHSANWRQGGESNIELALRYHGTLLGAVCWDLGAHFGIHTIGLAIAVGPVGEVCAFEPDPIAFNKLELHVRMNSLSQVKLFNTAASDTEGEKEMIVSGGLGSTLTHLPYEDESSYLQKYTIRIPTIRLDTLVSRGKIRAPDFVKVDVQGHGARALLGAKGSITATRPTILFSSHSEWECEGVRELVKDLGYRCYDSKGNKIDWIKDHTETAILVAR